MCCGQKRAPAQLHLPGTLYGVPYGCGQKRAPAQLHYELDEEEGEDAVARRERPLSYTTRKVIPSIPHAVARRERPLSYTLFLTTRVPRAGCEVFEPKKA